MSNFVVAASQEILADRLTNALSTALPGRIGGLARRGSEVVVKGVGADFTAPEIAVIRQIVAAHDGASLTAARQAKLAGARAEAQANALASKSVAEIDAFIDGADVRTTLKVVARYLKALSVLMRE